MYAWGTNNIFYILYLKLLLSELDQIFFFHIHFLLSIEENVCEYTVKKLKHVGFLTKQDCKK